MYFGKFELQWDKSSNRCTLQIIDFTNKKEIEIEGWTCLVHPKFTSIHLTNKQRRKINKAESSILNGY